jgi:hypothetical protein
MSWAISLQAQQFNVDFSPSVSVKKDVTNFHRYGNHLYSNKTNWGNMQFAFSANLKKVKYGVELTQYDEQLKELKTLSLDNGEKDFGPFKPLVHYGENAIYVMYFKFIDDDKVKMYVSKVNPKELSVVSTKEIMEFNQKNQGIWGAVKTIDDTQIFYTVSDDGKNAWIVYASPKLIVSSVVDGDLNLVQKTESVPVELKKLLITGAHIGNDGNKVLVYRYDNPGVPGFYARGLFFQSANTMGSFTPVKLPNGFFPGNLALEQSTDGKKLYLGGEYFGEDYASGGKGVLLGEVNITSQSISTPTFYPYTKELKQRVLDLDFASKRKGEIVFTDHNLNYEINEMENGTLVLSADMQTSSSTTNYTFYYIGPIVHVFIKPGGNVTMTLIPKKQAAGSYTSFFNYLYKDKLICIYADVPKYQEKEINDKSIGLVRTVDDMIPVANIYDSEGKLLQRKMLIDSKKKMKGNVMLGNRSKIVENKFLLPVGESKVSMVKYYTIVNQICYLEIL